MKAHLRSVRARALGCLATAVASTLVLSTASARAQGTNAATALPGMTLAPGSLSMLETSSARASNGEYRTTWVGAAGTVVATAPAGAEVSTQIINGVGQATIIPPQLATSVVGATPSATANPPDHTYFNQLHAVYCTPSSFGCAKANSEEYSIQEISGDWLMGEDVSGSGYGGTTSSWLQGAQVGHAAGYNDWPGEQGDSGPYDASPVSTTVTQSNTATDSVGISYGGFSFSRSWTQGKSSSFGPDYPHGNNLPAFGSVWNGCVTEGTSAKYEPIASAGYIKLGSGQSPYNNLVVEAASC